MTISYTAEHVARITAAARGQTEDIDQVIRQSWMRCLDNIGLDPATPTPSVVLENTQLRERQAVDKSARRNCTSRN